MSKPMNTLFQSYCLFQVVLVIKRHPGVRKISFIGHSLGGLVARYAVARLYDQDPTQSLVQGNEEREIDGKSKHDLKYRGKIAGLEPVNFITSACPHLGSRGHGQVINPRLTYIFPCCLILLCIFI